MEGRTTTIIRDGKAYGGGEYGGKLVVESLLPEKIEISKVGGLGKDFWIESTQTNYAATKGGAAEPGAWRIEVSPTLNAKSDIFSHVLTVMDEHVSHGPAVQKIENDTLIGARVLDLAVFFSKSGKLLKSAEFDVDGEEIIKILICNLEPGIWSVKRDNVEVTEVRDFGYPLRATDEGQCIYFKGLPGSYLLDFISQ